MNGKKRITYRHGNSGADIWRYIKAIGFPIGIFLLSLFCIARFAAFGTKLIAPLTGIMWTVGAICAIILPSHRNTILNETHITIGCYLAGLTVIQAVISFTSGVSSEMLMSAFNQAVPLTGGSTISGFMSTMLWITAVMTPIGFIGLQVKRVYSFKRKADKNKSIAQIRNIRGNEGHME